MHVMRTIAVIVGSASSNSINRKLATAVRALGANRFDFVDVRIDDFPMFNVDIAKDLPVPVLRMKREIAESDGVLFVTPEHNRSIPALLKNAIDWGSRPAAQSCWIDKPAAMLGASTGQTGTACAQQHLRNIISPQQMVVMGKPELYLHLRDGMIGAEGDVADELVQKRLEGFLDRFAAWIERMGARSA